MQCRTEASVALFALIFIGCHSQSARGPILSVSPTSHEFSADVGQAATTIVLKNAGDERLEIRSVESSCGCTTADLARKTLTPGEELQMPVRMERPAIGQETVHVVISTNSLLTPQVNVTLTCPAASNQARIVTILPQRIVLRTGDAESSNAELQITSLERSGQQLVESLEIDLDHIQIDLVDLEESVASNDGNFVQRIYRYKIARSDSLMRERESGWLRVKTAKGVEIPPYYPSRIPVEVHVSSRTLAR